MSEHDVRIYPAPRKQFAASCSCGESSELFFVDSRAEQWAREHIRINGSGAIVEPRAAVK